MKACVYANGKKRAVDLECSSNEGVLAELLEEISGELAYPVSDIPWYIEGSCWAFNPRTVGDEFIAADDNGTELFRIVIEN